MSNQEVRITDNSGQYITSKEQRYNDKRDTIDEEVRLPIQ